MALAKCECGKEYNDEDGRDPWKKLQAHKINHCPLKGKPKVEMTEKEKEKKRLEKIAEIRKNRTVFDGPQRKFSAPQGDGYHYRVVNDNWLKDPGRIQRKQMEGWEVADDNAGGFKMYVGTNKDGAEINGILMRIPEEIYKEDQARKQKEVDKVDEQIKGGTLEQKSNDKRYVPGEISITEDHNEPKT